MRLTRIFVRAEARRRQGEIGLPEQAGQHLTRVLRLEAGAPFTLFDGTGGEYDGHARRAHGKKVLGARRAHDPPSSASRRCDITLLQGVARGERMDLIVQKATELGVDAHRAGARGALGGEGRRETARAQARTLAVDRDLGLRTMRAQSRARSEHARRSRRCRLRPCPRRGMRCLLAAGAGESLAAAVRGCRRSCRLLIGPEGGLADNERNLRARMASPPAGWVRASCAPKPPVSPRSRHCRPSRGDFCA